jgi:hypothetical protein
LVLHPSLESSDAVGLTALTTILLLLLSPVLLR